MQRRVVAPHAHGCHAQGCKGHGLPDREFAASRSCVRSCGAPLPSLAVAPVLVQARIVDLRSVSNIGVHCVAVAVYARRRTAPPGQPSSEQERKLQTQCQPVCAPSGRGGLTPPTPGRRPPAAAGAQRTALCALPWRMAATPAACSAASASASASWVSCRRHVRNKS